MRRDSAQARAEVPEEKVESVPHLVQSGENFWTISRLYYSSGRYYRALWKANSQLCSAPEALRVGMTIRIPPPEELDKSFIDPPRGSRSAAGRTPVRKTSRAGAGASRRATEIELALPVADPLSDRETKPSDDLDPPPETRYRSHPPMHKVQPRETLRSIARDTLGDGRRYQEILELNRDVIDDPGDLVTGQVLTLPEDARMVRRSR